MIKKKVLFLRANPVAPDSRVEKEVDAILSGGFEVTILGWDRDADYPIKKEKLSFEHGTVDIYRVGIKSGYGNGIKNMRYLAKYQIVIWKFIKRNRFDIIHACDFDTAFTAYHCCNKKKTKFIYDIFDFYVDAMRVPSKIKPIIRFWDINIINHSTATIICTEERIKQIQGSAPKKLVVIHNTPPMVSAQFMQEPSNKRVKIAYFGIFSAYGRLIPELLQLVSENSEIELHIGGFGAIEQTVKTFAETNENIYYYGRVPYSKVLEIENNCDIITAIYDPDVPNHKYAAPNKFYESLMLGKPVIMVKETGMSDIVLSHRIGAVIDYSKEGLRIGIEQLTRDRESWGEMSKEMKMLYATEYSWETMKNRLLDLYQDL